MPEGSNEGRPRPGAPFRFSRRLFCAAGLAGVAMPAAARDDHTVRVETGVDGAGYPTTRWIAAISDRIDAAALAAVRATAKPLSPADRAWVATVGRVSTRWIARIPTLDAAFAGLVTPPRAVTVLLGNQGGDDGFALGADTVVMDLSALQRAYGDANDAANEGQIARLLSHEYTHLLIHPWLDGHGWREDRANRWPLPGALRVLFNEGLAGLRSVESERWTSPDGVLTPLAIDTLATLQPRMIERLTKLAANPAPDVAAQLMPNISQGRLTDKWGSIPIALWAARESRFDAGRLRRIVRGGPDRILDLAIRNCDAVHRPAFEQLQAQAAMAIRTARATPLAAGDNAP